MDDEANGAHDGPMIDLIAIIFWSAVFLGALGIMLGHLVTLLRSDGRGVVPPPRSHHDELPARSHR